MGLLQLLHVVFLLTLMLKISPAESSGYDNNSDMCLCQNSIFVVAHNSSDGVQIIVQDATSSINQTIVISSHHLPMECDTDYRRCNILAFQNNDKFYIIIPVIQGLAVIVLQYAYTTNTTLSYFEQNYDQFVAETNQNCSPTNIFFSEPQVSNLFITACLNLAEDSGSLYYLEFTLDFETGSLRQTGSSPREMIYNSTTLSETVYLVDQRGCTDFNNLYVIDDQFLLQCPVDNEISIIGDFTYPQSQIRECDEYTSIENYGGNLLLIRCSSELSVTFEPCIDEIEYFYASESGIPYPCSSWGKVAYLQNKSITIVSSDAQNGLQISLPFELSYGKCIDEENTIFVATAENGTSAVIHFGTEQLSVLTHDSGNKHFRPSFSESDVETIFSIPSLDSDAVELLIVNTTYKQYPIIAKIPLQFYPDLTTLLLINEVYNCECFETELLATSYQATTSTQTDMSTTNTAVQTTEVVSHQTDVPSNLGVGLPVKLIPVYVVGLSGCIFLLTICCFFWYKHSIQLQRIKQMDSAVKDVTSCSLIQPSENPNAYGHLELNCKPASVSESALKKCDVAVFEQPVMPAAAYNVNAVEKQLEKRCDTVEKTFDFHNKCSKC